MAESRWQKIDRIFSTASELSRKRRADYLRSECSGDDAMLSEVEALLREHDNSTSSLDGSIFDIGLKVLDRSDLDERIGSTIGHFKIGKLIGCGGMGAVYSAEDTKHHRTVAIKFISELFKLDAERIRRISEGGERGFARSHPNVAKLYELCELGDEDIIVLEFVDGVNLRQCMADGMPALKAIEIAIQIASALVAAHSVGVVHRDMKPENVIVQPDGTIKVLDFGLAKLVDPIGEGAIHIHGGDDTKLTVDMSTELGALMGTPAYMSPEQIRGAEVDTQTDIWSLGVLLYEMLSGHLPFRGPTKIDLIAAVLVSEPASVQTKGNVDNPKVNATLRKALAKEKALRYQAVGKLLADLRVLKAEIDTAVNPARSSTLAFHRAWKYAAGTVLLTAVLVAALPVTRQKIASYFSSSPNSAVSVQLSVTDGLVSYWPADGNTDDLVGGNDGELLNGATYRPGVSGQAFSFDGVDDLMSAPTKGFPTGNKDRTVAMWIKVDSFVSTEACFGVYGNFVFEQAYLLGASGVSLFVSSWGEGSSGPPLESERWYHVAATTEMLPAQEASLHLYLDGVHVVETTNVKMRTPANTRFYSGRLPGLPEDIRRLKGSVDEIKVYDRALSTTEIQTLFYANKPAN